MPWSTATCSRWARSSTCEWLWALTTLLALLSPLPTWASTALQLDRNALRTDLVSHSATWSTTQSNASLEDARAAFSNGQFAPILGDSMNFGFRDEVLWLHFAVERDARDASDWLLMLEYPLIDYVDLYRLDPDGQSHHWAGGDRRPFSERSFSHRYINFSQELHAPGRYEFYLRARSQSSMQIPLVWTRSAEYFERSQLTILGIGAYFGILAGLLAYNLILYISVRDRNFLFYVLYAASVGWMLLNLTGLGFQLLWPNAPDWNNLAVLLSMACSIASMTHFTRRFLNLQSHHPRSDLLLQLIIYASLVMGAASLLLPYHWVVRVLTLMVFPAALLILAVAIQSLRQFAPAKYFLWAWIALLLGIMVYASVALGWLPKNPFTEYSIHIGSAAEMVLLSFALAYRINMLTEANRRRLVIAHEQLEARVRERTHELDETLHRLEAANRQLRDFSRQDGLTGVLNRRSFEHSLNRAEEARVREDRAFALLMIDADRFKEVNDRFGHQAGDVALIHIAQLLQGPVQSAGGQLARYGGEEFAVILPTVDAATAKDLAEVLRRVVEQSELRHEGELLPLSISVGVAFRGLDAADPLAHLVRRADEALYRAKQTGRNRTVGDL
ncbi:sensor domain-containing diguanylate cyclase [Pseudomarimonas arenosa]|uniref:diguanylate cyclase n=1 Tax=Pseudomarimonas arenosa TaxID=2774145 RepID=A0AAW3ZUC1_9GAMM|nr:diguanylate cyclase [Pseudomarimonas arenosa]MBD8527691.1 diguanylate cyclase [Pseudomarimonas arenosa]